MKIYTKTGDRGETSLFGGERVRKDHHRVAAYGTVDELNAFLGLARTAALPPLADETLAAVQGDLFALGADLATPQDVTSSHVVRLDPARVAALEAAIDRLDADLPPLTAFILPGGTPAAAHLHIARTVCRRAERAVVTLADTEDIGPAALLYLNRLSDLLFTLARWVNHGAGVADTPWQPKA